MKLTKNPDGHSNRINVKGVIITLATGAIVALMGTWIVAALTVEPKITLAAASAFLEKFNRDATDPARTKDVWETMTTENYRRYVGLTYKKFAEFWRSQNPPSIVKVSKDGDHTFAVMVVYHRKNGQNDQTQYAAVLTCDDWQARWAFAECDAESLFLDDTKHYDYRVLQG